MKLRILTIPKLTLYPAPDETLKRRKRGQHLCNSEKLQLIKMFYRCDLSESQIWWEWSLSRSSLKRILSHFYPHSFPNPLKFRKHPIKLLHSDEIVKFISKFTQNNHTTFSVKEIQLCIRKEIGPNLPKQVITRILKSLLGLSLKRHLSQSITFCFDKNEHQKCLFWVKLAKWMPHLKLLLNVDESSFSKNTREAYSWSLKGSQQPIQSTRFFNSITIVKLFSYNWEDF